MKKNELFWNNIPGPLNMVRHITSAISEGNTPWVTGPIPWEETFRKLVKDKAEIDNSQISFTLVDIEELSEDYPMEELIFRQDEQARMAYMPAIPLAQYIQDHKLLSNSIFWLYNLDAERDRRWFDLSCELAQAKGGLRILCEGKLVRGSFRNVREFNSSIEITKFDTLLYAMEMMSNQDLSSNSKLYLSQLINELSEGHVEDAGLLAADPASLLAEPLKYAEDVLCQGNAFVTGAVRIAQIKYLYPLIEEKREVLIQKLEQSIRKLLPFEDEWGESYREPYEVELRHIVHHHNLGQLPMDEDTRRQLFLLYDTRNLIAHGRIVPGSAVKELLSH